MPGRARCGALGRRRDHRRPRPARIPGSAGRSPRKCLRSKSLSLTTIGCTPPRWRPPSNGMWGNFRGRGFSRGRRCRRHGGPLYREASGRPTRRPGRGSTMEQLTTLDAGFLEVEDSDPHVSLAVGGVSIVEGPAPGYDEFAAAFAGRVATIPRCRQLLRTHPLDLRPPEWVDDPHFDIARHLHRVALPHPGGDAELFEMVATLMERRLDRRAPALGVLDHRGAQRRPVGGADEDSPLHRRRHRDDADVGEVQRRRRRRHLCRRCRRRRSRFGTGAKLPKVSLNPLSWASGIGRSGLVR